MSFDSNTGEWLVPFKGRHLSSYYEQNFLWRAGNVYVMDNHRAALWCWLQHVDPRLPHSLFHIDRHYDTLNTGMKEWVQNLPAWNGLSIDSYLNHSYDGEVFGDTLLFRFDNYLSIYLNQFGKNVRHCHFATQNCGEKPNFPVNEKKFWRLPENLDLWIDPDEAPWIVNIDIDYFFCDAKDEGVQLMASADYIVSVFEAVKMRMQDDSVAVTTIALSPEYCGGWKKAEAILEIAMNTLGIKFKLPK